MAPVKAPKPAKKTDPPIDEFPAAAEATTPREDFELPIAGFQGTPEEIERQWFEQVYTGRGDSMLQLTWRAVLMGSVLGGVLSLTNIYIGLKAGWCFGVAITACILSYAIWTALFKAGLVKTPMTILENNCMQSTASSAGYSTGTTFVSAFAAYFMLNPESLPMPLMFGWIFFLSVLGVTMAIPMKRQMINIEQLRFPSGIAAAETLRALHSQGDKAMRSAKALGIAGLLAAVNQLWADLPKFIDKLHLFVPQLEPYSVGALMERLNTAVFGKAWIGRTVFCDWDPIFLAAGALTGLRVSASMMLGGTLCWAVFVPIMQHQGVIHESGFSQLVQWTLWGGAACMVASGLFSFLMQWRSMVRAIGNLRKLVSRGKGQANSEMDAIETPTSWFLAGQLISLIALALLAKASFGIPYWETALAVPLSFLLALVACRVTGETDTTPVTAMGQVTQLFFRGISPVSPNAALNMNVTLMSANITGAAASSSADLLTDLKSGYLLGANPRKQFLAQFAGIFAGTLVTVLCFRILVPNAAMLGSEQFPAPSAQTWRAVAVVLSQGIEKLGAVKAWAIAIGALVGIVLPLLAKIFPKHEKWIPSAAGIGLAWTFMWSYSLLFFLGALIAYALEKKAPKQSAEFLFPVASGVVAGGSLMAVLVIFGDNGPQMIKQLFGG
jgi:OPT family oligopeptide transporter